MRTSLVLDAPRAALEPEVVIDHGEAARRVRAGTLRELPRQPLLIRAPDLACVPFRDIVDLALGLSRWPGWAWCDDAGRREAGGSVVRALGALAREAVVAAPAVHLRHLRRVRRLERALARPRPLGARAHPLRRGLFIRSDHALGLAAGGSLAHLAGVAGGLRAAGVALEVLSSDDVAGIPADQQFHRLRPVYAPVRNVPELPELEYTAALARVVAARWEEWRPDFVYHRYSLHNYIGPWLRERHGVPFVCEYNGSFPWMTRHWEGRRLRFEGLARRVEELNLRGADLVVVVSRALRDEVVGRGVDPGRVLVNPNGVDPRRYAPDVPGDEVRRRYRLEGRPVVGFIGSFGPWHGAERLVEAAGLLAPEADLHFLLVGDGLRLPAVRARVAELGLGERVTLTGQVPQEQGPAHLAACDILVAPHLPNPDGSPFFGSPTKLFEYMAMGRAIVASALDQIGEVIEDGRTGLLVPPGDAVALAAAIRRLAADAPLRRRLGGAARAAAEQRHTWNAHARRILDALEARLTEGASGGAVTAPPAGGAA